MPAIYTASRRLSFLDGLTPLQRAATERAVTTKGDSGRRTAEDFGRKADALQESFTRDFLALASEKAVRELEQAIARQRTELRVRMQPPHGLLRDAANELAAVNCDLTALARTLRINLDGVVALARDYAARMHKLGEPTGKIMPGKYLPAIYDEWKTRTPFNQAAFPPGVLAPPDNSSDPHRYFVYQPPFFGFFFDFWHASSGNFTADRELYLDPQSGGVGAAVWTDCSDGGFSNHSQAVSDSEIAFLFTPPAAGVMEIIIDMMNLHCDARVTITDNILWSGASAVLRNYAMVSVLHPDETETQLFEMDRCSLSSDGDSTGRSWNNLNRVQHYLGWFSTERPVPGGQPVIITAGSRTVHLSSARRMDLHSRTKYEWFVSSVQVRIIP